MDTREEGWEFVPVTFESVGMHISAEIIRWSRKMNMVRELTLWCGRRKFPGALAILDQNGLFVARGFPVLGHTLRSKGHITQMFTSG